MKRSEPVEDVWGMLGTAWNVYYGFSKEVLYDVTMRHYRNVHSKVLTTMDPDVEVLMHDVPGNE